MSCAEVAQAIGVSESKISRMETGKRGLYAYDVAAILGFLQAPQKLRDDLIELVQAGETRNWHFVRQSNRVPPQWKDLLELEQQASALYNYETMIVPGLAQTAEYTRGILSVSDAIQEHELEALVAMRLGRQSVIGRIFLHLILDESVLMRKFGDPVMMHAQLRHLVAMSSRNKVTIQVLPLNSVMHPGLNGPFMHLEFTDQPGLVYIEGRDSHSFLEEDVHLDNAKSAWRKLLALALPPEASAALIDEHASKLI
ncbi:Putative DNA-binding protein [Actinosynnema pretiosum subsp. pretiosum]|nr:Putative DNA-binding protein [Actinosynnema pretiosum subsp. pretiosum]